MSCGCHTRTYRYPHTWVSMEKHGLVIPRQVRTMLEERDRDLEDFLSSLPLCTECDEGGCTFSGVGSTTGELPTLSGYSFDSLEGNTSTDGTYITLGSLTEEATHWNVNVHVLHESDDGSGSMPDLVLRLVDDSSNVLATENIPAVGSSGDWTWEGAIFNYSMAPSDVLTVTTDPYSVDMGVTVDGYCIGSL